jgi:hypothetical protein
MYQNEHQFKLHQTRENQRKNMTIGKAQLYRKVVIQRRIKLVGSLAFSATRSSHFGFARFGFVHLQEHRWLNKNSECS